jgi:hypothetical protein
MKRKPTPYLNEYNPDHFQTRRRMPEFQPERGLYPDGYVLIAVLVLAIGTAFFVWYFDL